ncbi:hypothetical protein HHI36_019759 [Cryptolaemus montrouzieri]|uniref:Cyclin N-terminal domain-containing protein n=1 Tax=Cryptolaemus montrouzieri TaxID=559131 RepID=A0ABD2N9D3_9CUCU
MESKNENESGLEIEKPVLKSTLIKKLSGRFKTEYEKYPRFQRSTEDDYQEEYIILLYNEEPKNTLTLDFLSATIITENLRFIVVDRLFKIQQRFRIPDNEYYMAIKIMDAALQICSEKRECELLAITSLWMVHKFNSSSTIPINHIVPLLDGEYSEKAFLDMERKVFSFVNFNLRKQEPSTFIEYYLVTANLIDKEHIYHGSFFVCDCLTKFPMFSYMESSFLAELAIFTTLTVFKEDYTRLLSIMRNSSHTVKMSQADCLQKIRSIYRRRYHREPFLKHSSMSRLRISKYFV